MNNKLTFCILCKSSATLMCQRCRDLYCSTNCQILDWPQHKQICIPMPSLIPFVNYQIIDLETPPVTPKPKLNQIKNGIVAVPNFEDEPIVDQSTINVVCTPTPSSTLTPNKNIANNYNNNNLKLIPPRVIKQDVPTITEKIPDPVKEVISVRTFSNPSENNPIYPSLRQQHLLKSNVSDKEEDLKNNDETIQIKSNFKQVVSNNNKVIPPVVVPVEQMLLSPPKPTMINNQSDKRSVKSVSNWENQFLPPIDDSFSNVVVQYVELKKSDILWVTLSKLERDCDKLIKEINKNVTNGSPGCCPADIKLNHVFAVPFEGVYYRAIILELLNPLNEAYVRLIDYGNEFYAKLNDIRQPIPLMINLNAFAFPIKFKMSSNKIDSIKNIDIGDKLDIKIIDELKNGIYLVESPPLAIPDNVDFENLTINRNANETSKITNNVLASTTLTNHHPEHSNLQKRFRFVDLKFINLPLNKKIKLYLLDASQINEGFITACILDTEKIKKSDDMFEKINVYCKKTIEKSYVPEIGELCLAKFNEDESWYRAVCLKINNTDSFSLAFVDYGNLTNVNSMEIRKITSEFMYPCLANDCSIAGVPDKIKNQQVEEFFKTNPVFDIEYAENIGENSYLIHMQF